jgi:hypothetical protein
MSSGPYRDELQPLRSQLDALRAEASALEDKLGQAETLRKRRQEVAAEAAELEKRLRNLQAQETLDGLRIASPCKASWDEMVGDDRVRFCGQCAKNVYNVAGMTRDEAYGLLRENTGGSVCMRLYKRADGTVLTADCPDGAKKKRVRRLAMVAGGVAATAAAAFVGFRSTAVMGEMPVAGGVMVPSYVPPVEEKRELMGEAVMGAPMPVGSVVVPSDPPPNAPPNKPSQR